MKQGPGEESWQVGGMSNGGKERQGRRGSGTAKGATERVWTRVGGGGAMACDGAGDEREKGEITP